MPEHQLPLEQFINAAKSTQEIIENFNQQFFEGKLKYEINVVPPSEGGLVESLKVIVKAIPALVLSVYDKDVRAGVIKSLSDKEPKEWAEDSIDEAKEECSEILAKMATGFLKKKPSALIKIGLLKNKFRVAYNAKNKIFQDCLNFNKTNAIGFDKSHNFPIKKTEFLEHITNLPAEEEVEEDYEWVVSKENITVNSPNWKRDNNRKWQGSTSDIEDISFEIEDENFWHNVKQKDINPDINDVMNVQWAYPKKKGKPSNVRVLKVLTYNNTNLSDKLSEEELFKELNKFEIVEKDQKELFEKK